MCKHLKKGDMLRAKLIHQDSKNSFGKGCRSKRFRRSEKPIVNCALYSVMLARDVKISNLANELNMSHRTIKRWIDIGYIPKNEIQKKIETYLNFPAYELFNREYIRYWGGKQIDTDQP